MKLVDRDYKLLEIVNKFGFCLSRHVQYLVEFPCARICDRRLKILVDSGYLERKRIIYGLPYLYYLTVKGKRLINKVPRVDKIRLDIIHHNVFMLDYLPNLIDTYNFSIDSMLTEKELHSSDSFTTRRHHPDLVFFSSIKERENKSVAVEFELTQKAKGTLKKNIGINYLNYDKQLWIVPTKERNIIKWIMEEKNTYSDLEVITVDS